MDFNLPYISYRSDQVLVDTSATEYMCKPFGNDKRLAALRGILGKFSMKPPIDERMEYALLMKDLFCQNFYITAAMTQEYKGSLGRFSEPQYTLGKRLRYKNMMRRIVRRVVRDRVFPFSQSDEDAKMGIAKYFNELRHGFSDRDIDLIFSALALSRRGPTAVLTNDHELIQAFRAIEFCISLDSSHPSFSDLRETHVYTMLGDNKFNEAAGYTPPRSRRKARITRNL